MSREWGGDKDRSFKICTTDLCSLDFDLYRIASLCKDYCGILNEEAIRLNFVLVYELLDEVLVSHCPSLLSSV